MMSIPLARAKYLFSAFISILFLGRLYSQTVFTNSTPIDLTYGTAPVKATPYPSSILVSGLSGTVSSLQVKLNKFSHNYPDGVDILLVAPNGSNAIILSDIGGASDVQDVDIALVDSAVNSLPDSRKLVTGNYQPTNMEDIDSQDSWPDYGSAVSGKTKLSTFTGINPNGEWKLYAVNDETGSEGIIAGGWSLSVSTVPSTPLPVKLYEFSARHLEPESTVMLQWSATEVGVRSYIIESSDNGAVWKNIGTIEAKGVNSSSREYTYEDSRPYNEVTYYRLKVMYVNGLAEYSRTLFVRRAPSEKGYRTYPNPARSYAYVYQSSATPVNASIQLIDMSGKVVLQQQGTISNHQAYRLAVDGIRDGVYLVQVVSGGEKHVERLVVSSR
jgi:hypothetical protein